MLIKKRGKNITDKIAKKLKFVYILYNRVLKKQIHCIRNLSLIQFALFGLILLFLVLNMSFIKNDNRYFIKNELNQISDIFTKENIFNDEVNIEQAVFTSMKSSSYYPMIIQTLYFLVWKIFGFHRDYALYIIQFFYIILLYSTYLIGKEIKSPLAGILSTFVLGTFSAIIVYSRQITVDIPLFAFSSLSLLFMIKKPTKKNLFCLGLFLGLSFITKQTSLVFISVPLVIYLLHLKKKRKIIIPVLISIFISFWYYFRKIYFYTHLSDDYFSPLLTFYKWAIPNMKFFELLNYIFIDGIRDFIFVSIGFFYFIIFIISILYFLIYYKNQKNKLILFSWIVIPYIFFSIVERHDFHFFYPAIPAVAILIGTFLSNLTTVKNKKINYTGTVLIIFVIIYGSFIPLFFYYDNSYNELPKFMEQLELKKLYQNKYLIHRSVFKREYFRTTVENTIFSFFKPVKFESNLENLTYYLKKQKEEKPLIKTIYVHGFNWYMSDTHINLLLWQSNLSGYYTVISHADECSFPNNNSIVVSSKVITEKAYEKCTNRTDYYLFIDYIIPIESVNKNLTIYIYES